MLPLAKLGLPLFFTLLNVFPNVALAAPQQGTPNNTFPNIHVNYLDGTSANDIFKMTGVDKLHEKGYFGEGIKICMIADGIDNKHPELKGINFKDGYDFVGDEYPSEGDKHTPDNDPYSTDSMTGTFYSGVLAGQGPNVNGVAPKAELGIYRVANSVGSGDWDTTVYLEALDRARQHGMDIVILSLPYWDWKEGSVVAEAANKLAKEGVIVVTAGASSGTENMFATSANIFGTETINTGMAEFNTIVEHGINVQTPSLKEPIIASYANRSHIFKSKEPVELVPVTFAQDDKGECTKFDKDVKLEGKVALLSRDGCIPDAPWALAQQAGAAFFLFPIRKDAEFSTLVEVGPIEYPVAMITKRDSDSIVKDLKAGESVTVSSDGSYISVKNPRAGKMSYYSAMGPTPNLDVGIGITGPAYGALVTYTADMGGYITEYAFTSSEAYIAGVAALLLEARKTNDTKLVRDILLQHTKPIASEDGKLTTAPIQQGSGFVDAFAALNAKLVAKPSNLALNYTIEDKPIEKELTISNTDSKQALTISFDHIAALSYSQFFENGTFTKKRINSTATSEVNIPHQPVKIEAGKSQTIKVVISPPKGLPNNGYWVYSGIIQAKSDCNETINIPYMGFKGNYNEIPLFSNDPESLPQLTYNSTASPNRTEVDSTAPYQINKDSYIKLSFSTIRAASVIKAELIDATNNKSVGYLKDERVKNIVNRIAWSNTVLNGTAYSDADFKSPKQYSNGNYTVKVSGLKPFGNPKDESGYQTWTSKPFTLKFDDSKKQ